MKRVALAYALLAALLPGPLASQSTRTASAAENARVRELANLSFWMGALVGERDGAVIVGMLVRPVAGVDLRGGDVIRSVNGTAVAGVAALNRAFDAVPTGRPVRLGIRRGGQTLALSFSKPADVPRATVHTQPREPNAPPRRAPRQR